MGQKPLWTLSSKDKIEIRWKNWLEQSIHFFFIVAPYDCNLEFFDMYKQKKPLDIPENV